MNIIVLVALFTCATVASHAAGISWSAQNLTGEGNVSTKGTKLEAFNFSGGTVADNYDTTLNGVKFEGLVSGITDSPDWEDPAGTYFRADSHRVRSDTDEKYDTTASGGGLDEFDTLLSQYIWGGNVKKPMTGGNTITLSGLIVNQTYEVQLFFADTEAFDRWIIMDHGTVNAFGGDGVTDSQGLLVIDASRRGLVITGTFTATEQTQRFTISQVKNVDTVTSVTFMLNAYQLRRISEPEVTTTLGLIIASVSDVGHRLYGSCL